MWSIFSQGVYVMKREEKNAQTRRKILDNATIEFATRGYEAGSLNAIRRAGDISKGIIYHYFQSKDDLYLCCVEECFHALTDYLTEEISLLGISPKEQLKAYFNTRFAFFEKYPDYGRLFCEAVIMPPKHLRKQIARKRAPFDEFNRRILKTILEKVNLRTDISREDIVTVFYQYQDFLNTRYQMSGTDDVDFSQHEKSCWTALSIFLFGIVESPVKNMSDSTLEMLFPWLPYVTAAGRDQR